MLSLRRPARRFLDHWLWFILLIIIWWVLSGSTSIDSWIFGLTTIGFIVWALPVPPLHGIRPMGLIRFLGFFIVQSLLAGLSVAWRALSWHPGGWSINPEIIEFHTNLRPERGLGIFIGVISLLPGTLSVNYVEPTLRVHVLDATQDNYQALLRLEHRVADLFGVRV